MGILVAMQKVTDIANNLTFIVNIRVRGGFYKGVTACF